jgi:hypothetical protein
MHDARYRSFRHGAAAIVGDYERAHDVVQEAFARALGARRGFRGGSPEAWLWRIVEREALDARRAPLGVQWQDGFSLAVEDPQRDTELAEALQRFRRRGGSWSSCATSPTSRTATSAGCAASTRGRSARRSPPPTSTPACGHVKIRSDEQEASRSKSASECRSGAPVRTHGAAIRQSSVLRMVTPSLRAVR